VPHHARRRRHGRGAVARGHARPGAGLGVRRFWWRARGRERARRRSRLVRAPHRLGGAHHRPADHPAPRGTAVHRVVQPARPGPTQPGLRRPALSAADGRGHRGRRGLRRGGVLGVEGGGHGAGGRGVLRPGPLRGASQGSQELHAAPAAGAAGGGRGEHHHRGPAGLGAGSARLAAAGGPSSAAGGRRHRHRRHRARSRPAARARGRPRHRGGHRAPEGPRARSAPARGARQGADRWVR
jgi:hypothetical protein